MAAYIATVFPMGFLQFFKPFVSVIAVQALPLPSYTKHQ